MDNLHGPARVFFDPNVISSDGLVSLNTFGFSKDGEYFAYGLSKAGSDWVTVKVRQYRIYLLKKFTVVHMGKDLPLTRGLIGAYDLYNCFVTRCAKFRRVKT